MEAVLFTLTYIILATRYLSYVHKKLVEYKQKQWKEVREKYILLIFKSSIMVFPLLFVSAIASRALTMWIEFMMNYIT